MPLADLVIAGDLHDVLVVFSNLLGIEIDQSTAHPIGMVDVVAKDDGLGHRIGFLQVVGQRLGNQLGALIDDQGSVKILLVIDAIRDLVALLIELPLGRPPALQIHIHINPHHLVGGQKAILDALLERIAVDRLAEVVGVGDGIGLLGGSRETNLGGRREIFEDLAPGAIFSGATAMTLVDDD